MSMLPLQYVLMFLSLAAVKKPNQGTKTETFMKNKTKRPHARERKNKTNSKLGLVLKSKVREGNEF